MLRYIVIAVFFAAAQCRLIPSLQTRHCRVVNDQVDKLLMTSNDDYRRTSITEHTEGINQYIDLSIEGSSIPIHVFLNTSRGELRSLNTLSRSNNATMCSDENRITLEGVFQFGILDLYFDQAKSQFLLMKAKGTFSFKSRPTVNLFIVKNRNGCYLDSYSIASTDSIDYELQPDSWTGAAEAKVLKEALLGADTTPLLMYVQEASQHFVKSHFTKAWCESLEHGN